MQSIDDLQVGDTEERVALSRVLEVNVVNLVSSHSSGATPARAAHKVMCMQAMAWRPCTSLSFAAVVHLALASLEGGDSTEILLKRPPGVIRGWRETR